MSESVRMATHQAICAAVAARPTIIRSALYHPAVSRILGPLEREATDSSQPSCPTRQNVASALSTRALEAPGQQRALFKRQCVKAVYVSPSGMSPVID
jgi:hypothetical protein